MAAKTDFLFLFGQIAEGHVRRTPLLRAVLRKLPSQERYLGLVHGSTAPSSRVRFLSGITRSMSKSMVLPKPWQRGQAPNGIVEAEQARLGIGECDAAVFAGEFFAEAQRLTLQPAAVSRMISPASR